MLEPRILKIRMYHAYHKTTKAVDTGSEKSALYIFKYKGIWKMITFMIFGFTCVVFVSHTVNVPVTDITRTSREHFEIIQTLQQRGTCKETTRNVLIYIRRFVTFGELENFPYLRFTLWF